MTAKTEKQKMLAGELYMAWDPILFEERKQARKWLREYNATDDDASELRTEMIRAFFGSCGDHPFIEPTFRCDYGYNIHVGNHFYANFDCVILDVCEVRIGDHCLMAPGVHLYTAKHPLDAKTRSSGVEDGAPITIGHHCWIGGGAIILPGVTIGDHVVIGAGSVVTKDIPSNVVAVGNPCKVIRELSKGDGTNEQ